MSDVLDSISTYLVISLGSLTGAIFRIKITYFFKLRNGHNLKAIFIGHPLKEADFEPI